MHALVVVALLAGSSAAQTPQPASRAKIRVELVGDSTQTDNAGYGRGFCANFTDGVDCINMAKGGASTKTYREEGLWDKDLATDPNYMVIQFGHNDEVTPEHLERQVPLAQYQKNLREFVTEARSRGITPVLVTPLTRRYFGPDGKIHSDLTVYCDAMKAVSAELNMPVIDLQKESIAYLDGVGEVAGMKLGITKKDADGKTVPDKTHLNWKGSYIFGRMVAVDLGKLEPELKQYLLPQPATLPAEGRLAMRVIAGSPFKIVLVGDSTVATEGGWGPGFCATLTSNVTCIDDALNGRSTKSYLSEGAWKKALAEKGQYYFIQFGHNDQKPDPKRHTDPGTTYSDNLRLFIRDARGSGAIPILVTPLSRRNYRDGKLITNDGLEDYAAAMRRVAAQEHVALVDLYALSTHYLSTMTQEQADRFDRIDHPDAKAEGAGAGKPDRTHLNDQGKAVFGRMVADNVIRAEVELAPNVRGLPTGQSPSLQAPADTN